MTVAGSDYLHTEVMTATPQKLQFMLVDAALRLANQARRHRADGQDGAASQALIRSQTILVELMSGLNLQSPDELVRRVAAVYLFVYRSLLAANLEHNDDRLADAVRVLQVERETWRLVCEQNGSQAEESSLVGGTSFEA